MIIIIDYGLGNIGSIKNMLNRIGVESMMSCDANDIERADKLILPGVGRFDYGMAQLHASGFIDVLNSKVLNNKTPILGICLGAQLMTEFSEEGNVEGLGWIRGKTVAFKKVNFDQDLKVPHMGWTDVFDFRNSKLFTRMYEDPRFYFVHSYHLEITDQEHTMVRSKYGYDFVAGIEKDNILGVQFHPEKSHKYGMRLLENFIRFY